jgi:glycosyltransferase involved in cell wall biosynthesis
MTTPFMNELPPVLPDKCVWPLGLVPDKTGMEHARPHTSTTEPDGNRWPRISIVTPSYNQGEYIEATIQSVLRQGYPNLEYIIIDGGSIDGSVDIIRRYESELAYWVSRPDKGMYYAINEGFAHATGEVLAWLNSDDMYLPWTLRTVAEIFTQHKARVRWICGLPGYWNNSDMLVTVEPAMRYTRRLIRLGVYENRRMGFIQQESSFWSRTLWEQAGSGIDTTFRLAGDFDLWRRFAKFAPLYVVSTILAGFRKHARQQTAQALDKYFLEIDRSVEGEQGGWIRTLLRNPLLSNSLFLTLRLLNLQTLIRYDPGSDRWVVTNR